MLGICTSLVKLMPFAVSAGLLWGWIWLHIYVIRYKPCLLAFSWYLILAIKEKNVRMAGRIALDLVWWPSLFSALVADAVPCAVLRLWAPTIREARIAPVWLSGGVCKMQASRLLGVLISDFSKQSKAGFVTERLHWVRMISWCFN